MKKKKVDFEEFKVDEDYDVYNEDYVDELLDDDEISSEEEAFMNGYNEG